MSRCNITFIVEDRVKELILTPPTIVKMLEQDFIEHCNTEEAGLSREDRKFLEKITTRIQHIDGHYQVPLPFRNDNVSMPNNRCIAEQRAKWLHNKFTKDDCLRKDLCELYEQHHNEGLCKESIN